MDKQKILIVDDDENIALTLSGILKRSGYKTFVCFKGSEALGIASREQPDLVITDIVMPGIEGIELLAALSLREIPTRVIVMTGIKTSLSDTVGFIKRGAVDVLHKPIEETKVIQMVDRTLALEPKFKAKWSEAAPYLTCSLNRVDALSLEVKSLRKQLSMLKQKKAWWTLLTRMIFLGCATGISLLFFRLGAISNGYTISIFAISLFILLSLPFDRIKSLSAKLFGSSGESTFNSEKIEP